MKQLGPPRVIRSVSLSFEFDALCREHQISPSEAIRVGISIILAERGIKDYDNNLNLFRRMQFFKSLAEEANQKIAKYETKLELNKERK